MTLKRPKILTAVTVPTGGWDLDFIVSDAASLDTPLTATIAAGEYFVAWDGQDDDLLYEVNRAMNVALDSVGGGFETDHGIYVSMDSQHRVKIHFIGSGFGDSVGHENDVELTWTTSHADLVKALGVDGGADDQSTSDNQPTITLDRQHGFGWYADEDGQLEAMSREDISEATTTQSRALDGSVKTVLWASRYRAMVRLGFLTAEQTWTDGKGYGDVPAHRDYPYNKGLEAWWDQAKAGVRFRVYEADTPATRDTNGVELFVNDTNSTTLLGDATKSWATDPQDWKGMLVLFDRQTDRSVRLSIVSNTATQLTVNASQTNFSYDSTATKPCAIYDVTYGTYVLDTAKMDVFDPQEIPNLHRYNIELPLLRYVA